MNTYKGLYPRIYDFQILYKAYLRSRRGRRYNHQVLVFTNNLEGELIQLQNDLIWKTYHTGRYILFYVYDPKTRSAAALPFRDRVLQHALCAIIEPLFDRKFIFDSYACRVNKGTHAGVKRVTEFLTRASNKWENPYCLKADIRKFFASIKQNTLLSIIKRTIACEDTLWLINDILTSWANSDDLDPRGLPLGNLTSQLWANVYLDQLDHYVKEVLQVPFYVRYMDDFIIIDGDKTKLWYLKREIEDFLDEKLGLHFNNKTSIFPVSHGVDFLGYRIWKDHKLLRKRSTKRIRRALKRLKRDYGEGKVTAERINSTVQSWLGHANHADSYRFRQKLFSELTFCKTLENNNE